MGIEKKTIKERIDKVEHAMNGNGAIGLIEQVRETKDDLKKMEKIVWLLIVGIALLFGTRVLDIVSLIR